MLHSLGDVGRGKGGLGGGLGGGGIIAPLCHPGRGRDDDNNDDNTNNARGEEQDMPYTNTDVLSCNWQWAEGAEGNVDDGCDDKHVDMGVQGPHRVDIRDG